MAAKRKTKARDKSKSSAAKVEQGDLSPEEVPIEVRRHHKLAICIGYNELAKQAPTVGEKAYYRLVRDNAVKDFEALGGHKDLFAKPSETLVTIEVPDGPPHIIFRAQDIELMRKAVREWDAVHQLPVTDPFELAKTVCQEVIERHGIAADK